MESMVRRWRRRQAQLLHPGWSSRFRETESWAGARSPIPRPSSSSPPRSSEERTLWHRLAWARPGPRLPNPPPMRPRQRVDRPGSGETETQNSGGICSRHSLSATEPRPDPRTPPARFLTLTPDDGRAAGRSLSPFPVGASRPL